MRRTRVRNRDKATFDIHDRVNYAVEKASTTLDAAGKTVVLDLQLDTGMSPVIDYFEIFLERMLLCRKAAEKLGFPSAGGEWPDGAVSAAKNGTMCRVLAHVIKRLPARESYSCRQAGSFSRREVFDWSTRK